MITVITTGAVPYRLAHFGQGTGPIFIRWISCSGSESSWLQCHWTRYQSGCNHYEDAGVRCEGILSIASYSTSSP